MTFSVSPSVRESLLISDYSDQGGRSCAGSQEAPQKVWTRAKILSLKICYFVTIYALFREVHYNIVHIAYFTELNLQFCNYAQKRRICCQNSKYAPVKNLCGQFYRRRKAANYCHPGEDGDNDDDSEDNETCLSDRSGAS